MTKSTHYEAPHYAVFSSRFLPLSSKYSPQHSVPKAISLCSSLSVRYQDSRPCKVTGKIIVSRFNLYLFREEKERENIHN